jgi:hypothetical protein
MRKDGRDHLAERKVFLPAVSAKAVAEHWRGVFRRDAEAILDVLTPRGEANLVVDYAMRLSGEALKAITGLTQIGWRDMDAWSQAMIDGIANYGGDPEVEARCNEATAAIDKAISERLEEVRARPEPSLLSAMLHGGLPEANIRHNIKLTISGGQNEPRDAIAGAAWALLTHPDQLAAVRGGEVTWLQAFEEYCRWIAPIGMSPRRIARDHVHGGVCFEEGRRGFLMFGAGNRDEAVFADPEAFDVTRDTAASLAFGAGPHFCAGAWASRALVAEIALPLLFERLDGLRLADESRVRFGGWAFRGPLEMPVAWDA